MSPLLEVSNIRKSFGSLLANRDISFTVNAGEVLAILGENGAGKTTLMNIIFGHYLADEGTVQCAGRELRRGDPRAAIEAGIGMVHQHFTLAENLTVLENTLIGTQSLWRPMLSTVDARRKLVTLADQFGLEINPDAYVNQMSVGEKQRLEILKTLFNDCRLLILDEPTASLTPQESNGLFKSIRKMVSSGLGVIIISHKLNEIIKISDRIIVLRAGETVGSVRTADANKRQLGEMIVGQKISRPVRRSSRMLAPKIELENICTRKSKSQVANLKNIDLTVRGGEIMGVVGVAGNGQQSLAEVLSGHGRPTSGNIIIKGVKALKHTPMSFMELGVAYIPEDRNNDGIVGDMSVWENAVLTETGNADLVGRMAMVRTSRCRSTAEKICSANDVRFQSINQPARLLSGGNIQKLLIGRWFARAPEIIVACQPSRGLDEGAISEVHRSLLAARGGGAAVVLISEDLDEILALSDNIIVMYDGYASAAFENRDVDIASLGMMMAGDGFHAV